MPGIVGLVTNAPREHAEHQLLRMLETLCHENFYVTGTWIDESLGLYVGWVARKKSFSDGMPLRNEQGDVVLIFSGEEFPEPDTLPGLKQRGHEFDAAGSSYLVHLYEEDSSFPAGLNGRFHGLVADRSQRTAVLFNDRFGMHRVYFHEGKDAFYFATEAKAILAVRPELRTMDPRGFAEFVSCGAVLENRTLFQGLNVLPPASAWIFRNRSLERKSAYFHPREWEEQEKLGPEPYYRELREVFARNVPRYFAGGQRIGMSLTGGLDTRMILAWQNPQPGALPCYTFGSMFRDNRDVQVARRVAKICKQPLQVLTAGHEFLARFPHYAERAVYLTDGCVDVGRAPDLYLNEKVREIAPVRMTGNYGGEILRRVRVFKPERPARGLFHPDFLGHVRRAENTYTELLQALPVSFTAFMQSPWYHSGILALEQTQLTVRSPYLDNAIVRTVFRAPEPALSDNEVSLRLISDGNPALSRIPTDRGVGGERGNILGTASRTLLGLQFKAEYAYDLGMPQWLAQIDNTLKGLHLERLFLGRHKVFHFRVWYRDALAGYVQEMLLDPRSLSRPYLQRKGLEAVVQGSVKGNRNYTNELHKVLTLELIHRVFLNYSERSEQRGAQSIPVVQKQIS